MPAHSEGELMEFGIHPSFCSVAQCRLLKLMEPAGNLVKIDGKEVKIPALGEFTELARVNAWYRMMLL